MVEHITGLTPNPVGGVRIMQLILTDQQSAKADKNHFILFCCCARPLDLHNTFIPDLHSGYHTFAPTELF